MNLNYFPSKVNLPFSMTQLFSWWQFMGGDHGITGWYWISLPELLVPLLLSANLMRLSPALKAFPFCSSLLTALCGWSPSFSEVPRIVKDFPSLLQFHYSVYSSSYISLSILSLKTKNMLLHQQQNWNSKITQVCFSLRHKIWRVEVRFWKIYDFVRLNPVAVDELKSF